MKYKIDLKNELKMHFYLCNDVFYFLCSQVSLENGETLHRSCLHRETKKKAPWGTSSEHFPIPK